MNKRPKAPRRYEEPRVFKVGEDLTEEQYQEYLRRIGDWYAESRATREPYLSAKQAFDRCLKGLKSNDERWWESARMTLASRVRTMCRYDIEKMEPIYASEGKKAKKRERDRLTAKRRRQQAKKEEASLLTDELRKELQKDPKYGDEVRTQLTYEEEKNWLELKNGYIREFPWLSSINAKAELSQLCDLHIMQERMRMDRITGKRKVDSIDLSNMVSELNNLKKALGIHPEQLKNKTQEKTEDVSIGAAAAKLDPNKNEDYRAVRYRFFLEELLQGLMMFNTPKADGSGYQLDEAGFFALFRCRTCHCGGCGQRNVAGFLYSDAQQILLDRGLIKLLPVPPKESNAEVTRTTETGPAPSN